VIWPSDVGSVLNSIIDQHEALGKTPTISEKPPKTESMRSKIADWITIALAFPPVVKYFIVYVPIAKRWSEKMGDILSYSYWPETLFVISVLALVFSKIYFRKTEKQRNQAPLTTALPALPICTPEKRSEIDISEAQDVKDTLNDHKEYTFREAAKIFAGENADKNTIDAAEKLLRNAVYDKKLNANLAYHITPFIARVKGIIIQIYKEIRGDGWNGWDGWDGLSIETKTKHRELEIWLRKQASAEELYLFSDTEWNALTIEYIKHTGGEHLSIDWDNSTVTHTNINEYCMNEGIEHEHFNPKSGTPILKIGNNRPFY